MTTQLNSKGRVRSEMVHIYSTQCINSNPTLTEESVQVEQGSAIGLIAISVQVKHDLLPSPTLGEYIMHGDKRFMKQ